MTLRGQIARATAWSFSSKYVGQALQFGTSVVVARYVAPEAYGLVGMATTITAFASLFSELGMSAAIIQRKELAREEIDSAFLLTIAMGLVMTIALAAAAPAIAHFFGRASLIPVVRVSAAGFVFAAIGIVPRALLVRGMRLGRVAAADLIAAAAGSVASVTLAIAGASLWAIVLGPLVATVTASACLITTSGWTPRGIGDIRAARPLIRVSLNLVAFGIVNYWARSLDNLLIGMSLGELQLGLYMRAYTLMLLPVSQLTGVLGNAMVPAMSRLQDDASGARRLYLDVAELVGFAAFPIMLGLAAVARPFIEAVFGPSWAGASPILQLLAPVGAIQAVMSPVGWIFISKGRTDLMFRWGILSSLLMMCSFVFGVRLGSSVAVAAGYLVVNVVLAVPCFLYAGRLIGIGLADFGTTFGRSFIAASAMSGAVFAAGHAVTGAISAMWQVVLLVPLGALLYLLFSRALRVRASARCASLLATQLVRLDPTGTGVPSRVGASLSRWFINIPAEARGDSA